ncbi:MAG: hypothetical protein VB066_01815 [Paludibacter sp.]|nr:hypothetical protein [Paludibacter sp.]
MGINKLYRIVESVTTTKTYSVKGFKSAKLIIEVASITGTRDFGFYGVATGTATSGSPQIPIYVNGEYISTGYKRISAAGTYIIEINTTDLSSVHMNIVDSVGISISAKQTISTHYEPFSPITLPTGEQTVDKFSTSGKYVIETRGKKQLECHIFSNDVSPAEGYVYVEKSQNGTTWENFGFYDVTNEKLRETLVNYMAILSNSLIAQKIFVNVEGINYVRFRFTSGVSITKYIQYTLHSVYKNKLKLYYWKDAISSWSINQYPLSKGYRYARITFTATIDMCNVTLSASPVDSTGGIIKHRVLDNNCEPVDFDANYGYLNAQSCSLLLAGNVINQSVLVEVLDQTKEVAAWKLDITKGSITGLSGKEVYTPTEVIFEGLTELPTKTEIVFSNKNDYKIVELPTTVLDRDVFNNTVIEWTATSLTFKVFGDYGIAYTVPFNSTSFPGIINGETILFAYLLPFNKTSTTQKATHGRGIPRCCIFTSKSRVLHNFPDRYENATKVAFVLSDMLRFAESNVIVSDSSYKNPVNDKALISSTTKYLPILSEYNYQQFDGRHDVNAYGAPGLPSDKPLLDQKIVTNNIFDRLSWANMAKDDRLCVFGNYNNLAGQEPFVMVTDDGGRIWYVKNFFATPDNYSSIVYGSKITFTPITAVTAFTPNSMKLCRRKYNFPTSESKEPVNQFEIPVEQQSLITAIGTSNGTVKLTLADDLTFDNVVYPIVFIKNVSATGDWQYIFNDVKANGSDNTGVFFHAKRISANNYELYQCIGDVNGATSGKNMARHIHCVNRTPCGYLISTGETRNSDAHQGGDLFYLNDNTRDGSIAADAQWWNTGIVRLTSTVNSINRLCGAFLFTDTNKDAQLLFVSDSINYFERDDFYVTIPGRTEKVKLVPYGIYLGKLSDVDDYSKFRCICQARMTIISLVENRGHFVAEGHTNAIYISKDGLTWENEFNLSYRVNGIDDKGNIYIGNKKIIFK